MISKEAAYKVIEGLVERFEEQIVSNKKAGLLFAQLLPGFVAW